MKTRESFILFLVLLATNLGMAQSENVFLNTPYWETNPSVEKIKQKIAEGNDPTALTPYAFDAVVYSLLGNAPSESIKYLLTLKGNEVDKMTHDGRNYLMWAAYKGNVELVDELIKMGSDTKIIDDHGYSVLTFAAVGGQMDPKLYDLILTNGAKIDETDHNGANILHLLAANIDNLSELDYFIKKGLDIKSTDALGNTMFNYAATKGKTTIMDQLIAKGLDYKTPNKEGGNAMIYASYGARGYTNPIKVYHYLEKLGINPNVVTDNGTTPLHSAVYGTEDTAIIDYFLEKGVDVNQKDEEGNTAFLNAVNWENIEFAKYLLPKVDDINHKNSDGYSALTYTVINKQAGLFDDLLSKGADATINDKDGNSLTYHAFKSYDVEKSEHFLKSLKAKGVDLAQTQGKGNTIYHLAVDGSSLPLLKKAKELGIEINQKNEDGLTPLHLAAMKSKDETILKWLLTHGADKTILTDFDESAFDLASENELLSKNGVQLQFLKK
nr:ankyrin repeat domain-containing protein [Allomuricauda sp.]